MTRPGPDGVRPGAIDTDAADHDWDWLIVPLELSAASALRRRDGRRLSRAELLAPVHTFATPASPMVEEQRQGVPFEHTRNERAWAVLLALALCATACGGGSSTGRDPSSADTAAAPTQSPAARLETLTAEVTSSLAAVTEPIEEAPAVLDALQALLARAQAMSAASAVVETAPTEPASMPEGDPSEGAVATSPQPDAPPAPPPDYRAAVIDIVVSVVNTGAAPSRTPSHLPPELQAEAQNVGSRLRDLLAALAATGDRVVAFGATAGRVGVDVQSWRRRRPSTRRWS